MALKTFQALIGHCRSTTIVDEEIKKTRKGLTNISMDYINDLVSLYLKTNESNKEQVDMDGERKKN